jgi:O-antigen/teichoic acid export membrane protein
MRRPRLKPSLTVNAVSLIVATAATSVLGLVFWTVAARLQSAAAVGRAAAAIAALTLLAGIGQLNLNGAYVRLLPAAGGLSRRLIGWGYGAACLVGLLAGIVYAATGLGAGVLSEGFVPRAAFVMTVAVLALFALQDSILIGLRASRWVPVENAAFSVAKLVILPVFVITGVDGAIVVSWVIPAAVAVLVVSTLLFKRVLPRLDGLPGSLPHRRRLVSLIAGGFVDNLVATATVQLMPLVVIWKLGPAQAAYFTLPWLVWIGITLLLWDVASSCIVEVAGARQHDSALLSRGLLLWGVITVVAVVVCVLGADPLLSLAGARYAQHGAALLRLLGLAAPFSAIVALYGTVAWLDQRMWRLVAFRAASGAAVVVATVLLIPNLGLEAAGWANLAAQALAAAAMAPLIARRLRGGRLLEAR